MTKIEYGMNLNPRHSVGQPQDAKTLQGIQWVRLVFQISAAEFQSVEEAFEFYDPIISSYRQVGARPLLILNQETFWGNGPWDHGGWDVYARDFGKLAGKIAAHYVGQEAAYEIWNEGDIKGESSVYVSPSDFAPVLELASASIKAQDPAALVVFGGLASGTESGIKYVEQVSRALHGALPVDAIGIHPYGHWPPAGRPDIPTGWFAPLDAALQRYASAFAGTPIWITEIGISEPGQIKEKHWTLVADYMEGVFHLTQKHFVRQIPVVIWFAWSDVMRDAGIVDLEGKRKGAIYDRFFALAHAVLPKKVKKKATGVLTPTDENLRVREGADTTHRILALVNPGDRIGVLEPWETALPKLGRRGQWVQVRTPDGIEGWTAARYLKLIDEESKAPPAKALTPTDENLRIREGSGRQFKIIAVVNPGDRLEALEPWETAFAKLGQNGKWIQIRTPDDVEGWTAAWYLKLASEDEEADETPILVTALTPTDNNLRVRQGPGAQFAILAEVNPGDRLEILGDPAGAVARVGQVGQWIQVRTPEGIEGWTAAWFVRPLKTEDGPAELPKTIQEGQFRALSFDHEPQFGCVPVCDPSQVRYFSGFGPNNYSYLTYIRGTDYYHNLCGLHNGLDLGAPVGTPLCAADWGVVVHVSKRENDNPYSAGPYSAIVRHGGYVALYGHMMGVQPGVHVFVKAGDIVAPGDPIGLSGTANGFPHLHFEMRKIDPAYIEKLRKKAIKAGMSEPMEQYKHMNKAFHPRGWNPTRDYYANPARFFKPRLESYRKEHHWQDACPMAADSDGSGYPDRVILENQSQPMDYDLYTLRFIPAWGPHFWKGSRPI